MGEHPAEKQSAMDLAVGDYARNSIISNASSQ
jgi:hypothetical protein